MGLPIAAPTCRPHFRRVVACSAATIVAAAAVGAAGCGPADYTYITNADVGTYLRIPSAWHSQPMPGPAQFGIDARDVSPDAHRDLADREWLVGIDGGPKFDDSALIVPDAGRPKGFVQVRTLLPEEAADVSTNDLRNLFVDVEAAVAEQREAVRANPHGARLTPGFELLVDEVARLAGGVHGVHLVYQVATVRGLVTVDQTSLLDQDQTVLYQLVLACSAQCYDDYAAEVDQVRASFTVAPASERR